MSECQLKVAPFYQCCCNCIFHLEVNYPCNKENHEKGICYTHKGWACVCPTMSEVTTRVLDDWEEHSCGCELYTPKDKYNLLVTYKEKE